MPDFINKILPLILSAFFGGPIVTFLIVKFAPARWVAKTFADPVTYKVAWKIGGRLEKIENPNTRAAAISDMDGIGDMLDEAWDRGIRRLPR